MEVLSQTNIIASLFMKILRVSSSVRTRMTCCSSSHSNQYCCSFFLSHEVSVTGPEVDAWRPRLLWGVGVKLKTQDVYDVLYYSVKCVLSMRRKLAFAWRGLGWISAWCRELLVGRGLSWLDLCIFVLFGVLYFRVLDIQRYFCFARERSSPALQQCEHQK